MGNSLIQHNQLKHGGLWGLKNGANLTETKHFAIKICAFHPENDASSLSINK